MRCALGSGLPERAGDRSRSIHTIDGKYLAIRARAGGTSVAPSRDAMRAFTSLSSVVHTSPLLLALLASVAAASPLACGGGDDGSAASADGGASIYQGADGGAAIGDDGATSSSDGAASSHDGASAHDAGSKVESPVKPDHADPFVLHVGGVYHLYSTNTRGKNLPHMTTTTLASWAGAVENDAMPTIPSWASSEGIIWAPGVLAASATHYVVFFAAKRAGSAPVGEKGQMCIGRAVATDPGGPFVDGGSAPLFCMPTRWSLDPSPFADADGSFHLVWRQDVADGAGGTTSSVYEQALNGQGDAFAAGSDPVELIRRNAGSWEDPNMENPAMIVAGGKRLLFYSANSWKTDDYAIGYAECSAAAGPCTKKTAAAPWLASMTSHGFTGPGGEEVIRAMGGVAEKSTDGTFVWTMHGWTTPTGAGGTRALFFGVLDASGAVPRFSAL